MAALKELRLKKLNIHGKVVDGGRVWETPNSVELVDLPPRPDTDYSLPVACYQCGQHRPRGRTETSCLPCANSGHDFRLMGRMEMLWVAQRDRKLGYAFVASRSRRIALTLPPEPREVHCAPNKRNSLRTHDKKATGRVPEEAPAPGAASPRRRARRARAQD